MEPVGTHRGRALIACVCACAALAAACVGSGDVPVRVTGQIVGSDIQPLASGLVLIEQGPLHASPYVYGTLIGPEGRFSFDLPKGGTWGVHLFHNDYSYLPVELKLADHEQRQLTNLDVAWGVWKDLTGLPSWPNQPDDVTLVRMPADDNPKENPLLEDLEMHYLPGGMFEITCKVTDPNNNLSRMILAHDPATGLGYALNPPGPPNLKGQYPNGIYKMKAYLDPRHVPGQSVWYFVVSNMNCKNSPIKTIVMPPK